MTQEHRADTVMDEKNTQHCCMHDRAPRGGAGRTINPNFLSPAHADEGEREIYLTQTSAVTSNDKQMPFLRFSPDSGFAINASP